MKSAHAHRLTLLASILLTLPLAHPRAEDTVVFRKAVTDAATVTENGRIREDSYKQIILAKGGVEIPIKRELVVSAKFEAMPADMESVPELMDGEQWDDAMKALGKSKALADKVDPLQSKPILQYVFFSLGELQRRKGEGKTAAETYKKLLAFDPTTRFYFDANLGVARALEDSGELAAALDQYKTAYADFKGKIAESGAAAPAVALAGFGVLRVQVLTALRLNDPAKAKGVIDASDAKLEEMMNEVKQLGPLAITNDDVRVAAKEVRALIWRGQGKWKELVDFLDKQILESQQKNQKQRLEQLYGQRADAQFELKVWNAAVLDYLRLALVYEPAGEMGAKANLRAGICFINMKGADWKERAQKHLAQAQKLNVEPWSKQASDEFKKLQAEASAAPATPAAAPAKPAAAGK